MLTQLTTVYTQAYQLAFSLALQAQNAYRFELGNYSDTFFQSTYWDSRHKGLTAGRKPRFRSPANGSTVPRGKHPRVRNYRSTFPSHSLFRRRLVAAPRNSARCNLNLDETLFDSDYPGHYFRRLRSVALTIPCVTGPYTGVNANADPGLRHCSRPASNPARISTVGPSRLQPEPVSRLSRRRPRPREQQQSLLATAKTTRVFSTRISVTNDGSPSKGVAPSAHGI